MIFNLMNYLNASNPTIAAAIQQPGPDGLMRHGISLVGAEGQPALRDALRDQAQLPETYLAIYVTGKDALDAAGTLFDENALASIIPYKFGGHLLVHKATYDENERYQYKELIVDGLLSGKDYYYGVKLFVDGVAQPGFSKGAFTTHGTAYAAPNLEHLTIETPVDNYKLKYNILEHDMSTATGLIPRFEVVNKVLSELSPSGIEFVDRDVYDPKTPSYFELDDQPGTIFQRYVIYDVQVRYISAPGSSVGVSPATVIASNVQIPWMHNFVDEVILKGGGIDQQILEDAAAKVAELTPAEREAILAQMSDGDLNDIGRVYQNLLKQAALENIATLESQCDAMRANLRKLMYQALAAKDNGPGMYTTVDLQSADGARVYNMITAPADVRGYPITEFVKFSEGIFYVSDDVDANGEPTQKTRLTFMGQAAFERFFIHFNNRRA